MRKLADGSIRIDTKLKSKNAEKGLNKLNQEFAKTKSKIKDLFSSVDSSSLEKSFDNVADASGRTSKAVESDLNKAEKATNSFANKMKDTESQLRDVENQMDMIGDKIYNEFKDFEKLMKEDQFDDFIQGQIEADSEYQKLQKKQEELNTKVEEYAKKMQEAKAKQQELTSELEKARQIEQEKATVKSINTEVGEQTDANRILDSISTQEQYNQKLEETKRKLQEIEIATENIARQKATNNGVLNTQEAEKLKQKALETNAEYQKMQRQLQVLTANQGKFKNAVDRTRKSVKSTSDSTALISKGITSGIKKIGMFALALLSIRSIYGLLSRTANAWLNSADATAKQLRANFDYMAYAVGSALQPVLQAVCNILYKMLSIVASIIKLFSGINIFSKASAKHFSSMQSSASGTSKELKRQLASFDEMNRLEDNSSSGGGGGAGSPTPDFDLSNIKALDLQLDGLYKKIKEIWDLFKKGFDIGFGDTNFDGILNALSSIKKSLIDIWTDPGVLSAMENCIKSWIFNLGKVVGSIANIAVTIAENLLGGIALYLEQNKDVIKQHIIRLFDISAELANIIGDYSVAIADIFTIFRSSEAKQVTADIIGIFTEGFYGVAEVAGKIFNDLSYIITKPIIENKDLIKETLSGMFEPLHSVLGTLKQGIQDTFSKFWDVYDTYIGPAVENIKNGFSSLLETFLTVWNDNINPLLTTVGENFSALWAEHIQPMVDKLLEFLGKLINGISELWNTWLVPIINWIVETLVPVLTPILESLWKTISNVFGKIMDVLGGIWDALSGLIDFIVGVFTGDWEKAWEGIKEFFGGIWDAIKGIVGAVWEAIKGIVETAINIVKGIIQTVLAVIQKLWEVVWNAISSVAKTIWNGISSFISSIINTIKNTISNILNAIQNVWSTVWNAISSVAKSIWNGITGIISNVINGIKTNISNVLNAIKTVWTNIWNGLKTTTTNIFNGIWNAIKGVINSILGGIEGMVNGVINGLNKMIGAMNKLSFDVPDWVPGLGGKKFGFNIPTLNTISIPRLARGGIVSQPTRAIVGEAGKEAILPLENNLGWIDEIIDKIVEKIKELKEDDDGDININVVLDGEIIERRRQQRKERLTLATNGRWR